MHMLLAESIYTWKEKERGGERCLFDDYNCEREREERAIITASSKVESMRKYDEENDLTADEGER